MKCEIIIDDACEESVVIHARSHSSVVEDIRRLALGEVREIIGYRDRSAILLDPEEVAYFATFDGEVYAGGTCGRYRVSERLYELEERLPTGNFIRINQSCIANLRCVERFDVSLGGSLIVIFKDGYRDYVSRRQLKSVKERLGIKR